VIYIFVVDLTKNDSSAPRRNTICMGGVIINVCSFFIIEAEYGLSIHISITLIGNNNISADTWSIGQFHLSFKLLYTDP